MHELNYDGTEARDEFGRHIQTYDNYDIMSNARVLTGFIYTARRGNVEELFRSNKSRMDPMRINVDAHDFFPKPSVDGNWIGDRYPLCRHMPKHHFLKIGATFRFRGGSSLPQHHYAPCELLLSLQFRSCKNFHSFSTLLFGLQHIGTQTSRLGGLLYLPNQSCTRNYAILMIMESVNSLTLYPSMKTFHVMETNAEWMKSLLSKSNLVPFTNTSGIPACSYHSMMMQRRL